MYFLPFSETLQSDECYSSKHGARRNHAKRALFTPLLKLIIQALFFCFYLAIAGKASLESFILHPIRENIYISPAANDIIIIYLCQNITEL